MMERSRSNVTFVTIAVFKLILIHIKNMKERVHDENKLLKVHE